MSWFKHSSKAKSQYKRKPYRYSPLAEKRIEEAKEKGPSERKANK